MRQCTSLLKQLSRPPEAQLTVEALEGAAEMSREQALQLAR
jgi:hypothetical protein